MKPDSTHKFAAIVKACCILLGSHVVINTTQAQLSLTSGTSLVTNGNPSVVLNDFGLSNSGTINAANSVFVFTGTAASVPLSSTSALGNITINKASGVILMGSPVSVTGTVQLTSGNINLNGYDLDLGTTGSLSGESAASYVTGTTGAVLRTMTLNAPAGDNPGNLGLAITSAANFGSTVIRRSHQQQAITGSANSINRYYDILPANTSALNAPVTLRMYYLDAELAGLSESSLGFYTSADNGITWQKLGSNTRDVSLNYVENSSLAVLSRVTLADNSAVLPISLLSFTGKLTAQGSELQWITGSEQNNRSFEIERSADGRAFSRFAVVASQGNSGTPQTYSLTDPKPFSGVQFYRLKQVNTDGSYTYSKIVALSKSSFANQLLNVFPVPAKNTVNIHFTSSSATETILRVTNEKGQVMVSRKVQAIVGFNNATLDVSNLAAGIYYLTSPGISEAPVRFVKIN